MEHNPSQYQNYTEEQFAADEYFQQWVLANNQEADAFWNDYITSNPGQRDMILNAKRFVEELSRQPYYIIPLSDQEKLALKTNILNQIQPVMQDPSDTRKITHGRRLSWQLWSAAAALLAVVAIPMYVLMKGKEASTLNLVASDTEVKHVILPDSSEVVLNAGSSVSYNDFGSGKTREVYLRGNAFFKVRKDKAHKEFVVHANDVSITVLGTQFNVNVRSAAVEVALTQGKVRLSLKNHNEASTNLVPGERAVLDTLHNTISKSAMNNEQYAAWTQGKWIFSQTSLQDVANLLHEYYGVNTVFKNDNRRLLKITAVIPVSDLQTLTGVIAKTLQITISQTNNQLIIH
ncbi:FecR domain-containing protein [Danxiaibacter flavus]|uniref:FecR domain-containing protein n=1 Tax=Danxiaibacter flavus TaxID=3049108 RepID=A0ABV3ZBG0_9BACT|nr:FecR domain-containing protein [Chitinophagaceae bacterium DXS]